MSTSDPLLRLEGVTKVFYTDEVETHALAGIHLEIQTGEYVSIAGPSGCGKSTLLSILGLLDSPSEGAYSLNNKPVQGLRASERARIRNREIGFIFQSFNLIGDLSVFENVELPLTYRGMKSSERRERVQWLFARVGLRPESAAKYPHEFSGGQRQRLGIARALALNPKLIVCDEPVSALDVSVQAQVVNLLMDLQEEFSLTYLFIAHDLSVVEHISDRVAVMYLGKIVEVADAESLYRDPKHPSTRALLSAVPVPDPDAKPQRIALKGDLPSPAAPPSGCAFHPRCPVAVEVCSRLEPKLLDSGGGHLASCHLVHPDGAGPPV